MTYDNFDKEYDFSLTKNACKSKGKKKGKDKKKIHIIVNLLELK